MQRFSKKRQAILDCVASTACHPDADWVYAQLKPVYPDMSLGTVYRNLAQLSEAGMIRSMGTIGGHEHFDGKLQPHSHLICKKCAAIVDVEELAMPTGLIREAEACTGGTITGMTLQFSGLCAECSTQNNL